MRAVKFEGANAILKAPFGEEERVYDLPYFKGVSAIDLDTPIPTITTCFELSKEEIVEMNNTGKLFVTFWGRTIHPVMLTTENPIVAGLVKDAI